jgi:hypothetical protein
VAAAASEKPAAKPSAAPSGDNSPIDERYLDWAKKKIAEYDKDGSGDLSADEWGELKDPEAADANKDKRVSAEELARWKQNS